MNNLGLRLLQTPATLCKLAGMHSSIFIFLLLLSICQQAVAQTSTTSFGNDPKAGHYVKTRGFNMYYETYGSGEPLLIIHGNGGSISNFENQIPYFSKSYKVILADSRAQGKSADTADSLSYEMMADDLNALLDTLHLDSCYVIGWSDGGINGLLLAIRHPDKVKKLAVTGANLTPDTTAVDPFVHDWARNYRDSIATLPATAKTKTEQKLFNLLSNEPHISLSQLHQIKCPSLIIGGDHDILLPRHTMLIADNIPHSYLWIIPNSGHSTPIFYAADFNRVVDHFFQTPYRKIDGFGRFN